MSQGGMEKGINYMSQSGTWKKNYMVFTLKEPVGHKHFSLLSWRFLL